MLAVAVLVFSRTWISDRIASLNGSSFNPLISSIVRKAASDSHMMLQILPGTTVKFVLEQDKAAFIRLIGVSILQSGANSFVAPSLR